MKVARDARDQEARAKKKMAARTCQERTTFSLEPTALP